MNPKKIAVVLSGCGFLDGSEITEAVSSFIAISEAGASITCFAPNLEFSAISHYKSTPSFESSVAQTAERRNILNESARIARGEIHDIAKLREKDFDGLVFPGGFGAAIHLSNWGSAGAKAVVLPEIIRVIREFHTASKPMGFICIAPTLAAKILGHEGVNLTIGDDPSTAAEIEKTGAHHVKCPVEDYVSDRDHKILSTPAYMYEAKPHQVLTGISKMMRELIEMA
jgi:enhancing lycopene biosynthesis protein 2